MINYIFVLWLYFLFTALTLSSNFLLGLVCVVPHRRFRYTSNNNKETQSLKALGK